MTGAVFLRRPLLRRPPTKSPAPSVTLDAGALFCFAKSVQPTVRVPVMAPDTPP